MKLFGMSWTISTTGLALPRRQSPASSDIRRRKAHGLVRHGCYGTFQQLDVGFVLAGDVRIFEENGALAATFQYAVGNLGVAAQRAALEAMDPFLIARPAAAPGHLVELRYAWQGS